MVRIPKNKEPNMVTPKGTCKDLDKDCNDITDHFACWIGGITVISGIVYIRPTCPGTCPYIHHAN